MHHEPEQANVHCKKCKLHSNASNTYPQVKGIPEVELTPHSLKSLFADVATLWLRAFKQNIIPYLQCQQHMRYGDTLHSQDQVC